MVDLALDGVQRRRSLTAAISITSVVGTAMGLTWPLLSLILERQGVDSALIGLSSSSQTLAFLIASAFAPRVIGQLGMVRTLWVCTGVIILTLLILPLHADPFAWMPTRFVLGAGAAILFIGAETWVNAITPDSMRGRVVGIFGFLWAAGFGMGPLIIRVTGIEGWTPFLVGVALVVAATIPLLFANDVAPVLGGRVSAPITRYIRLAPAALLAAAFLGVLDTVSDAFLPLYGLRNGLSDDMAVTVLAVYLAGLTMAQIPIGWLADRFDRRGLLLVLALGVLALILLLPLVITDPILVWPVVALLGACGGGIWAVSLVLIGERFRGVDLAGANAARGVLAGIGAVAGPLLAGSALHVWDPHGVPMVVAIACVLFLLTALWKDTPG
jgi:MFS family permease